MSFVETKFQDNVAVLKLSRDVTNALNRQLINQLRKNLQVVQEDLNVHSLVLSSSNDKFFSIGFDIPELIQLNRKDFTTFYQAFNQACMELYVFPKPTIAAITGHATAGGCILALSCDYRIIAEGRKLMGLNEIKLGIPVPYPGDCILRQIVSVRASRDIMSLGEFYPPQELLQLGIVDQVLPLEKVKPKSIEKAKQLGSFSADAFGTIKRNRVEDVEEKVQEQLAEKEHAFIDCWFASKTRERLQEAMRKF